MGAGVPVLEGGFQCKYHMRDRMSYGDDSIKIGAA